MLNCIQQWLTLVLYLVAGVIAVILVAMVTYLKDSFSAASIGQSQIFSPFQLLFFERTFHTAAILYTLNYCDMYTHPKDRCN